MTLQIVLASNPGRLDFQDHFLKHTPEFFQNYVYIAETLGMELGAIREAAQLFPRFLLLQDTHVVNNWSKFWQDIQSCVGSWYVQPRPACYAAVYDREVLDQITIPEVGQDKELSIHYETAFLDQYERLAGKMPVMYPDMTDGDALSSGRYYDEMPDGPGRLHLQSSCGTLSKMKRTFR